MSADKMTIPHKWTSTSFDKSTEAIWKMGSRFCRTNYTSCKTLIGEVHNNGDRLLEKVGRSNASKNFMAETIARFIFENIISRFGCPNSLNNNQGKHFINETIKSLLESFMTQHHKMSLYHLQDNGTIEAFNKILEKSLTKICNVQ